MGGEETDGGWEGGSRWSKKRRFGGRKLSKVGGGDQCCIDKTSSAELSEAINSMYQWYQRAQVCYAYLVDVPGNEDPKANDSKFRRSRWFKRGWTLQELLAPKQVIFWSREWVDIGTRSSLQGVLSSITKIHAPALGGGVRLSAFSIAQRMSWASDRVTTRPEDMAYCLLGIFDVNMPLLYGEGAKAFKRLQEEIMKESDDHSIFAWQAIPHTAPLQGLLAQSPRQFVGAAAIVARRDWAVSVPYAMTNKGLRIELFLLPRDDRPAAAGAADRTNAPAAGGRYYWAILSCYLTGIGYPLAIELKAITDAAKGDQFARAAHTKPFPFRKERKGEKRTIFVRSTPLNPEPQDFFEGDFSRTSYLAAAAASSTAAPAAAPAPSTSPDGFGLGLSLGPFGSGFDPEPSYALGSPELEFWPGSMNT